MEKKTKSRLPWLGLLLLAFSCEISSADMQDNPTVKSASFLSPELVMKPGSVEFRLFYNIPFPEGHIGLKSFNGELVDEAGVPIPLYEAYIHHWALFRSYNRIQRTNTSSDTILVRNNGVCPTPLLGQYFGMGSEGRKTKTYVPDPYAVEVGTPPVGYKEGWILNIHVLDSRGVVDRVGCRECRCNLYNVSSDETGKPLKEGYEGGFHCCYNQTQCRLQEGFTGLPRKIFFRYTVEWVDWDQTSVLPVRLYIFDATDVVETSQGSEKHDCKEEYKVMPCKSSSKGCTDSIKTSVAMPKGGYVVYATAFQYPGGTGASISRKDGQLICGSKPIYGRGKEIGNEDGYIVGMPACYPKPGSVQIADGETLVIQSNYSSSQKHTGASGLLKIYVADQLPKHLNFHP